MDKVLNALKCSNCRSILTSPVTLPCGHTICQSHTRVSDENIICSECESSHANKNFAVNQALANMIEAQLSSFDFGPKYKECVQSVENVREQLRKNELAVNDSDYFIHESIDKLRNKVVLKSEQLKTRIDEITQELLDDLDMFERECKEEKRHHGIKQNSFVDEFKRQNDAAMESCEKWSNELNELRFDDHKWTTIKEESEKELGALRGKLGQFERELLANNESDKKKYLVDLFETVNLDSSFNLLNILCRFNSSKQHKFQLLYRGSRDGFSAADFHSKCDSRANTITIIETSKGFVFGAFTQASWSSGESGVYKLDPNAFLFSLVNPFEKPFVCQITKPDYAIYCEASKGPTFGKWPDIQLCYDLSSVTVDGHVNSIKSELTRSYDRPSDFVIDDPDGLYFCESEHFHVREIEVFQIV